MEGQAERDGVTIGNKGRGKQTIYVCLLNNIYPFTYTRARTLSSTQKYA